ncbi:hypothetical protein DMB66_52545 [Actinoplanes sp. ATCC 53533]|nr:hypothetical protein DMB66_52545 [Actinoplanes sp. ATCC 53533]
MIATNEPWRPRQYGVAGDLVYRSQFTTAAPDLRRLAAEQFSAWVASKGVALSAASLLAGGKVQSGSPDGARRVARSTVGSYTDRETGRQLHAAAFQLDEYLGDGTSWTTSLRLASPYRAEQTVLFAEQDADHRLFELDAAADWPEVPWIWLDLEHHRGETGAIVRPGSPRLVRDLLAAVEGTDGSLPLTSDLLDITAGHVGELCGWLFDANRRVPVVVFTPDPQATDEQHRFATRLARDVAGVAVVVRLPDAAAAAAFSRHVGPHLQVYGGAMRTYLPGLTPQELFPRRHRVLSAATMRALRSRSANAVRDQVLSLSTRRTSPPSYPLVRRVLARGSAEQSAARRRPQVPPAMPQPTLFPDPAEQTLFPTPTESAPSLDRVPDTEPPMPALAEGVESAEANRVLRASLTLGGIDPSAIGLATVPADQRLLEVERRALQDLLIRSVKAAQAAESAATTGTVLKLAEATTEIELLYAEIDDLTQQLGEEQRSQAELEYVRTERDVATIDLSDSERDNERLRARARWLESELTRHQVHLAGVEPPDDFAPPEIPASIVEVLDFASARLPNLEIGATSDAAAGLDVHPRAEHWAFKIWKALAALNSYAEARKSGQWSNSFLAWCLEPPSGGKAVPATWAAMSESETTNTMPKLREARTFTVPRAVIPAGRLYMPAHVKIQQGGTPCPRIHFHDDTGGATGQVYVGYVGDHLPTANFK